MSAFTVSWSYRKEFLQLLKYLFHTLQKSEEKHGTKLTNELGVERDPQKLSLDLESLVVVHHGTDPR